MAYTITDPRHPDLVLFYAFERVKNGKFVDAAGNYDGVIDGVALADGKLGKCADFGTTELRKISQSDFMIGRSDFSFSFYKYEISTADQTLWATNSLTLNGSLLLSIHNLQYWQGGVNYSLAPGHEVGVWRHIIYSVSASQGVMRLYKDGILDNEMNIPTTASVTRSSQGYIGYRYGSSHPVQGLIDQFRVFGRALTDTEAAELAGEQPIHVAGNVTLDGSPLITTVRVYDEADGILLGEAQSDAAGAYSIPVYTYDPVYVMAVGGSGRRPLVHGPVIPLDQV